MLQRSVRASSADLGRRGDAARFCSRRRRGCLAPLPERLEVRDCPSGAGSVIGLAESSHALVAAGHDAADVTHEAVPKKAASKAQTIYVAPTGKSGATAGKNAKHPLGSLTLALKRAKAGTTIVLAAGTYTQNAGMTGKSGITIQGAAGGASVLSPSGGQALKIYSSSGIAINDVAFRTGGSDGIGLAIVGSSVTLNDVTTAGTSGDGVVINGGAIVTAMSSHFDSSHTGDGMDVQDGTVTISNSTFNGNGAAGGSVPGGSGLSVEANSQATITNSQFNGNLNAGLVAMAQAQVTASGSTFANNSNGDGAIFSQQTTANLTGNNFSSNGTTVGYASGVGYDGVEFLDTFTGKAVVSNDTFSGNTGDGLYVGNTGSTMQITGNTFSNNLVGLNLDASVAGVTIGAVVTGNTFSVNQPLDAGLAAQGLVTAGNGVTATVGGAGSDANTFENFGTQSSILEYNQNNRNQNIGSPNLTAVTLNVFTDNGQSVSPSQAIGTCC